MIARRPVFPWPGPQQGYRSEEHTSELQSQSNLLCRLLLAKKTARCVGLRQPTPPALIRGADDPVRMYTKPSEQAIAWRSCPNAVGATSRARVVPAVPRPTH